MNYGISTSCFFPLETERALKLLGEKETETVEIFFNTSSEFRGPFSNEIRTIVRTCDMKVAAVHPHTSACEPYEFFTPYKRRFDDALDGYRRLAEFCLKLGENIIIPFHGDLLSRSSIISDEEYFERFCIVSEALRNEGAILAQENVNLYRASKVDFIKRLKAALPHTVFVYDIKQVVRAGENIYDMLDAMGGNLGHLHLSDNGPQGDCLLPFSGNFDFTRFFGKLEACNYAKAVILEVYSSAYRKYDELFHSFNEFIKSRQNSTKFSE